jgi:hypothetical protein
MILRNILWYINKSEKKMSFATLFGEIVPKLLKNGISFHLKSTTMLSYDDNGTKISAYGWYDSVERSLEVAVKYHYAQWVHVLAHEYGHSRQHIEMDKCFTDGDQDHLFDLFTTNRVKLSQRITRILKAVFKMELDAEMRAIGLLKDHGIFGNYERVYQRSNAYLYVFIFAAESGIWYKTGPQFIKEIVDVCPGHHLSYKEYWKKMPRHMYDLYKKYITIEEYHTEKYN